MRNNSLDSLNPYGWELEVEEQLARIQTIKKLNNREQLGAVIEESLEKFRDKLGRVDAMLFPSLVELVGEVDAYDRLRGLG